MNGIKLTFEGASVSTAARLETFCDLVRLAETHFPHLQVETAAYRDEEGDEVVIRSDKDVREAMRLAAEVLKQSELEIQLLGRPLTTSFMTESQAKTMEGATSMPREEEKRTEEPEIAVNFAHLRIEDQGEDRYLTCFKCNGDGKTRKGKPCRLCEAQGVINVVTHPRFRRITELVREEIRATMERIRISAERFQVPETGEVHEGVTCDNCNVKPIVGPRYKCSICDNFDFCPQCEKTVPHPHPFIKIRSPDVRPARIVTVTTEEDAPESLKRRKCAQPSVFSCQNASAVSVPSGVHASGETVKVAWTVKNAGSATWPNGCRFQCMGGTQGTPVSLPQVAPGETFDVEVAITLPSESGAVESHWQAMDPSGEAFGERFRCSFTVESASERTSRQAKVLLSYMQRDAELAAEVLSSCGGNVELANEKLAQILG